MGARTTQTRLGGHTGREKEHFGAVCLPREIRQAVWVCFLVGLAPYEPTVDSQKPPHASVTFTFSAQPVPVLNNTKLILCEL